MITPVTDEYFESQEGMKSRWAQLMDRLRDARAGDAFEVDLKKDENTGAGRRRARQSIYAIARYNKIDISIKSGPTTILVKKLAKKHGPPGPPKIPPRSEKRLP